MNKMQASRESGYTLVEALVVMMIFGIIFAIIMGIIIQVSYSSADNMARTSQVQNAELGLMQIDRQVRSGNVILDPANERFVDSGVDPGYSLRVFTQTNGVHQCVQWRVIFNEERRGVLEYRSWDPDWTALGTEATDWAAVARDLVSDAAGTEPFSRTKLDPTEENTETSSVDVKIFVQAERTKSAPTAVGTTLTGRNTIYGYAIDRCDDVPVP